MLLDLCTLSRGPDGRTQKLDLTPDMEKYSELTHVSPWNETTILSLGIEGHQIPDKLLFIFWTCGFSSIWGDSAALGEALPKWIISKATGICNSREWMSLKGCLVLLLATFWRHSGYDSFWLWLSIHTRQQPSCQREIGMKEKSSHWVSLSSSVPHTSKENLFN